MIVRAAAPADIPAMAAIVAEAHATTFQSLLPGADLTEFDVAHFSRRFGEVLPAVQVAETSGAVLGLAMVRNRHLDMLFIAVRSQGRGMGPALLRAAETAGAVTLECFAANSGARRFYSREGWVEEIAYSRPFAGASRPFVRLARHRQDFGRPLPDHSIVITGS